MEEKQSNARKRTSNSTERGRKFRKKLTPEAKAARRAQNAKYQQEKRAQRSSSKKSADKNALRIRMQKLRAEKAKSKHLASPNCSNLQSTPSTTAFANRQSKSRAAKKLERSFPESPNRTNELLIEACIKRGIPIIRRRKGSGKQTSEKIMKVVQHYYLRDDISRMCPGRKERVFLRDKTGKYIRNEDGSKKSEQQRYLMYTIRETYELFKKDIPQIEIGKSKFAELRPQQVLLVSQQPQNVCMCVYHANMKLLVQGLLLKDMTDEYGLITVLVCNEINEQCMNSQCDICGTGNLDDYIEQHMMNLQEDTTWYQWEKDNEGKMVKVRKEGPKGNVVRLIKDKSKKFLLHHFTKVEQSKYFQMLLKQNHPQRGLLQIDFSENYNIKQQDAIQSAYWGTNQIAIYTAAAWIGKRTYNHIVVSDYLSHDRYATYIFNNYIIADLKKQNPRMNCLDIFSDGAGQHFKQRYTLSTINEIAIRHGLDSISWNFFATSHGKGAVDGIGGMVKRIVWNRVRATTNIVENSLDFAKIASEHTFTPIQHISKEEIEAQKSELDKNLWADVKAFPRTHKIHCVRGKADFGTRVFISSLSKDEGLPFDFSASSSHNEVSKEISRRNQQKKRHSSGERT